MTTIEDHSEDLREKVAYARMNHLCQVSPPHAALRAEAYRYEELIKRMEAMYERLEALDGEARLDASSTIRPNTNCEARCNNVTSAFLNLRS